MTTLMDIHNKRTEKEKEDSRKQCRAMYENAVAAHNAAVLGIFPSLYKMPNHEGLIITGAAG